MDLQFKAANADPRWKYWQVLVQANGVYPIYDELSDFAPVDKALAFSDVPERTTTAYYITVVLSEVDRAEGTIDYRFKQLLTLQPGVYLWDIQGDILTWQGPIPAFPVGWVLAGVGVILGGYGLYKLLGGGRG